MVPLIAMALMAYAVVAMKNGQFDSFIDNLRGRKPHSFTPRRSTGKGRDVDLAMELDEVGDLPAPGSIYKPNSGPKGGKDEDAGLLRRRSSAGFGLDDI
jgi:hypothetical protein